MNGSAKLLSTFFVILLCLCPWMLVAQTTESLGFNSVTGEQFECIQFAESRLNTIRVIKVNSGRQSVLSPKQAIRKMRRGFKKLSRRRKTLSRSLKRARRRFKKLTSTLRTPQAKIDKVKNQIAKLDTRLAQNAGDRELFKALIDQIRGCAEDAEVVGNFRVFSQVYDSGGGPRFTAALYYSVSSKKKFRGLRTRISGLGQSIPGAITAPVPEAPQVAFLTVRENMCLTNIVDVGCVKELPGRLALLISIVGSQKPGTCGTVNGHRCSMSESVSLLTSLAGGADVKVLSRIK